MSNLSYYTYPNWGEKLRENIHYSQAVRIGDRIECSGQGGWDPDTGEMKTDLAEEVDQAFRNVDLTLRSAGGKGWSQVFRINLYQTINTPEFIDRIIENLRKWLPDHQPILTGVVVKELHLPTMHIELEVVANDQDGAQSNQQ
ncbi:endoribonuclease L-psp family protein [Thozetella sp. PMI_491]|nr:endoribonuclease L-psp family protein [Thozetella sp. PMI_491]